MTSTPHPRVRATVVPGHRVASGLNGNPLFPGGTLRMQQPFFHALGLDLSGYYPGTLNISLAPLSYNIEQPRLTFHQVHWHPTEPAEDFSFFDVNAFLQDGRQIAGLIYYPHPSTKPTHFQQPDVLELLLPWTAELQYGDEIHLEVPPDQMTFQLRP